MNRVRALWMPAFAFMLVGAGVMFVLGFDIVRFRGGPLIAGISGIAFAVVLSAIGVLSIDPTTKRLIDAGGKGSPGDVASRPLALSRGLVVFYTTPFLPSAGLSFGLGMLLSVIAHGLWPRPSFGSYFAGSEVFILGAFGVFVALAIFGSRAAGRGAIMGYAIGIFGAAFIGEATFSDSFMSHGNLVVWVVLAAYAIGLGVWIQWLLGRRRAWTNTSDNEPEMETGDEAPGGVA